MKMLNKEQILAILKENKPFLEKEMGVKRIGLFGSYAKDHQTPQSDVDIFLEMEEDDYKKILSVLLLLEQQFGKNVDLICKGNYIRPSFLHTLEKETIYA